jgi:hypothetical protein
MLKDVASVLVIASVVIVSPAWAPAPRPPAVKHSSGIEILGPEVVPAMPDTKLVKAWSDAIFLAEYGDGLGYPWADTTTSTLVLSTTNAAGNRLANQWISSGVTHGNPKVGVLQKPSVPVRIRTVSRSYRDLEAIKLDATRLAREGLPDADAIYEAAPDWEQNRIVLTLSRESTPLLNSLAVRYGTSAIAVRIEPQPSTAPLTRTHDYTPFYGGAIIHTGYDGCSSGFSWTDGSTNYMLSAGHCAPNGADKVITTDANFNLVDTMGTNGAIASGTRENWTAGTGTSLFPGDSTYRGDVALIRVDSIKGADPYIYSGVYPDETSRSPVHNMWWTVPAQGEQYCSGGSNTYALCGWTVTHVRVNWYYTETHEWALNITKGQKSSSTSGNRGDSGGPVYTVNADGTIAAKGIISGGNVGISCNFFNPCVQFFTDILLPYYWFPGWLKTL